MRYPVGDAFLIKLFNLNLGGEIKEQKGQVAMENVQQPKLVVHKGQKGPKPQGNKQVLWPLVNNPNRKGHPSKLWSNLSPKPKKSQMVEAAIRPAGPGEAEHAPGALWKCALMFVLHFPPAFLELVLEVVLNGVLLRNKKEPMSFFGLQRSYQLTFIIL